MSRCAYLHKKFPTFLFAKRMKSVLVAAAAYGVGLGCLVTGIVGSNFFRNMDVCLCVSVLCCPVKVEAFATGWSLVQGSPTKHLNKITKPPV
jgi:hypothetical protein